MKSNVMCEYLENVLAGKSNRTFESLGGEKVRIPLLIGRKTAKNTSFYSTNIQKLSSSQTLATNPNRVQTKNLAQGAMLYAVYSELGDDHPDLQELNNRLNTYQRGGGEHARLSPEAAKAVNSVWSNLFNDPITQQKITDTAGMLLKEAIKEILWLRSLLEELKIKFSTPVLKVDNQGAIALAENPVNHQRTKHIDIKWHFIRDHIDSGRVKVIYVPTGDNIADILTKATPLPTFRKLSELIMQYPTEQAMMARMINTRCRRPVRRVLFPEYNRQVACFFQNSRSLSKLASLSDRSAPLVRTCKRCPFFLRYSKRFDIWGMVCGHCEANNSYNPTTPFCTLCLRDGKWCIPREGWYCPRCEPYQTPRRSPRQNLGVLPARYQQ